MTFSQVYEEGCAILHSCHGNYTNTVDDQHSVVNNKLMSTQTAYKSFSRPIVFRALHFTAAETHFKYYTLI